MVSVNSDKGGATDGVSREEQSTSTDTRPPSTLPVALAQRAVRLCIRLALAPRAPALRPGRAVAQIGPLRDDARLAEVRQRGHGRNRLARAPVALDDAADGRGALLVRVGPHRQADAVVRRRLRALRRKGLLRGGCKRRAEVGRARAGDERVGVVVSVVVGRRRVHGRAEVGGGAAGAAATAAAACSREGEGEAVDGRGGLEGGRDDLDLTGEGELERLGEHLRDVVLAEADASAGVAGVGNLATALAALAIARIADAWADGAPEDLGAPPLVDGAVGVLDAKDGVWVGERPCVVGLGEARDEVETGERGRGGASPSWMVGGPL
jgi:hypothetical protein